MIKISASELINKWVLFFKLKNHFHLESQSLIPKNDNSLLFINSGISAIKRFFSGEENFHSKRIVNCQKVIRTGDIEEIGDTHRHLTYFEMLGNFSLGDYFKEEAINWAYEFLVYELKINLKQLYFTVYKDDDVAFKIWKKLVKDESRIIKGDKNTNFWDMGVGPCGPCTEIFFDRGSKYDPNNLGIRLLKENIENDRYLEIWNIVFSEFFNNNEKIIESSSKNIDTGAGLERLLTVLEEAENNFENSLFLPIIKVIEKYSKYQYTLNSFGDKNTQIELINKNFRIISDHIRAVVMLLSEKIKFGNKGREYILRKLFRKILVASENLELKDNFLNELIETTIQTLLPFHPNLISEKTYISEKIIEEQKLFFNSKKIANKNLEELIKKYPNKMPEEEIFLLFSRDGLPKEIIFSSLNKKNISFSEEKYKQLENQHKLISKNFSFTKAFSKDIKKVLNIEKSTKFNYQSKNLKKSSIVALFNENFEEVLKIEGCGFLVLDETIIFPNSAGQEEDTGWVNDIFISKSFKTAKEQIFHYFENGKFFLNQTVSVSYDESRRKKLEQNHTSEHILYALVKNHISPKIFRISGKKYHNNFVLEVNSEENLDIYSCLLLTEEFKRIIAREIPVKTSIISLSKAKDMQLSLKFEDSYELQKENLRCINIEGITTELCIGTHIKNTSEIEDFLITSLTKKQKNIYRFECIVGFENINNFLIHEKNKHRKELDDKISKILNYTKKIDNEFKFELFKYVKDCLNIKFNFLNYDSENYLKNLKIFNFYKEQLDIFFRKQEKLIKQNIFEILKNRLLSLYAENIKILEVRNYQSEWIDFFLSEIKNKIGNSVIVLLNSFNKNQYFYLISNSFNVKKIFNFFQENFKCKGGGSENYFQGIIENCESLKDDFLLNLKNFCGKQEV